MKKQLTERERFNKVMDGLLAVPYQELQKELEKERKQKEKKKRAKTSPASRASNDREH